MKLFFLLLALCLVLLRAYFAIEHHSHSNNDNNGTISVDIGDYDVRIKWSGKIVFNEAEDSILSIPPGGYLQFRENNTKLSAESNLQGVISYTLYDGRENLPVNDSGRRFIKACITKMIAWGFNGGGRAERINKKGGYHALLLELSKLKMQNAKGPYLDLILRNDSVQNNEMAGVIGQLTTAVSDIDKENILQRITPAQRKDTIVAIAWLGVVEGLNADVQKVNLLSGMIQSDSLSDTVFDKTMSLVQGFHADIDKQNIYHQLIAGKKLAEYQWIALVAAAVEQHADIDKSNLLIDIAQKAPHTALIKESYLQAARKINNDADYGRAVKQIE